MKLLRLIIPSAAGLLLATGTLAALARGGAAPASPPLQAVETGLLLGGDARSIFPDAARSPGPWPPRRSMSG